MLEKGIKGIQEITVTPELSAKHIGSGTIMVLATPMMVALMEKTCRLSVSDNLDEGFETVGTQLNVSHCAATPLGMTVRCESELVEIDRRRLVFKVACYDEAGLIGEGTHERFIIDEAKFQAKVNAKLDR